MRFFTLKPKSVPSINSSTRVALITPEGQLLKRVCQAAIKAVTSEMIYDQAAELDYKAWHMVYEKDANAPYINVNVQALACICERYDVPEGRLLQRLNID